MVPDATGTFPIEGVYDFTETTRLLRTGGNDPTFVREPDGFWCSQRQREGASTLHVTVVGDEVHARAWGPGAQTAIDRTPRMIGLHDNDWELTGHPRLEKLAREHRGVRLTDTGNVYEALVNICLQQLVTWNEAAACWRRLVEGLGETAPGPRPMGVLPRARRLGRTHPDVLRGMGIGQQRARTIVRMAAVAHRMDEAAEMETPAARARLEAVAGIGPWTSTSVLGMRLGRPELAIEGDYHLPNTVAWFFRGEERGTEAQMHKDLAPFEGQVFRVIRLMAAARIVAPRRAPRRQAFQRHRF